MVDEEATSFPPGLPSLLVVTILLTFLAVLRMPWRRNLDPCTFAATALASIAALLLVPMFDCPLDISLALNDLSEGCIGVSMVLRAAHTALHLRQRLSGPSTHMTVVLVLLLISLLASLFAVIVPIVELSGALHGVNAHEWRTAAHALETVVYGSFLIFIATIMRETYRVNQTAVTQRLQHSRTKDRQLSGGDSASVAVTFQPAAAKAGVAACGPATGSSASSWRRLAQPGIARQVLVICTLLATHEVPFLIFDRATDGREEWAAYSECVQAVYHRSLMLAFFHSFAMWHLTSLDGQRTKRVAPTAAVAPAPSTLEPARSLSPTSAAKVPLPSARAASHYRSATLMQPHDSLRVCEENAITIASATDEASVLE